MTNSLNLIILYSAAITSLLMMISKKFWIKKQEVLEPEILKISKDVHKGTISFLKRQYTSSAWVIGSAFFVLLFLAYKDFISFYTPLCSSNWSLLLCLVCLSRYDNGNKG